MKCSAQTRLRLGVAALGVGTVVVAGAVSPPPVASTAARTSPIVACVSGSPSPSLTLSQADVRLLTAVSVLSDDAATPAIATTPSLIALANAIDDLYVAVEEWVRYGFEVASDIVAWIPWVGIFANQIMVVYNFVESLINSGVFNTTDWLRGEGSALKNVADWVVDLGLAVVWLGIDEIGAWIPLPPIDVYPPRPPAADLPEGFLGGAVVAASHLLAEVSHGIWDLWEPIRGGISWGVDAASNVLDVFAWIPFVPLLNFEITAGWDLIAGEIDALTGFAHDMIDAGDQFVSDTVQGDGLIAAIVNAFDNTVASIVARTGQAWTAFTDWVDAQVDFFLSPFTRSAAEESDGVISTAQPASTAEIPEADVPDADVPEGAVSGDSAGDESESSDVHDDADGAVTPDEQDTEDAVDDSGENAETAGDDVDPQEAPIEQSDGEDVESDDATDTETGVEAPSKPSFGADTPEHDTSTDEAA